MNTKAKTITSFARKIGNTTYTVKVCCNEATQETFEDKLIRLITNGYLSARDRREAQMIPKGAPV